MLKKNYALEVQDGILNQNTWDEGAKPVATRLYNQWESMIIWFYGVISYNNRQWTLTFLVSWLITTMQFCYFISNFYIDYGWNSVVAKVFMQICGFVTDLPGSNMTAYIITTTLMYCLYLGSLFTAVTHTYLSWVIPVCAMRYLLFWLPTVFFIPMVLPSIKMAFGCVAYSMDANVIHPFFPNDICWSHSHSGLTAFSLFNLIIFTYLAFTTASFLYDNTIPSQRQPRDNALSARLHNRAEAYLVLTKLVLLILYTAGHSASWRLPMAVLLMVAGAINVHYQLRILPWWEDVAQMMYVMQGLLMIWTGLIAGLMSLFDDSEGTGMLYFIALPVLAILACMLVRWRHMRVDTLQERDLDSAELVLTLLCSYIKTHYRYLRTFGDIYIDDNDHYSTRYTQMIDAVDACFNFGSERFPGSADLRLFAAHFHITVRFNRLLAFRELNAAGESTLQYDMRFQVYQARMHLHDTAAKHQSMEVAKYLEFKERKVAVEGCMAATMRLFMLFWSELLEHTPDVEKLSGIGHRARTQLSIAVQHYERLLVLNPQSVPILKQYAMLLLDIIGDQHKASTMLLRADQAERTRRKILYDCNYGHFLKTMDAKLDIFDDDNGIVTVSVGEDSLGIIQEANASLARIFGYSGSHDLIGKNINILIPEPIKDRHDEYLQDFLISRRSNVVNNTRMVLGLNSFGYLVGLTLHVRWSDEAMGKLLAVLHPVSSNHEVCAIFGMDGRIIHASANMHALFGFHRRTILGRGISMSDVLPILRHEDGDVVENARDALMSKQGIHCVGTHSITQQRFQLHAHAIRVSLYEDFFTFLRCEVSQFTRDDDAEDAEEVEEGSLTPNFLNAANSEGIVFVHDATMGKDGDAGCTPMKSRVKDDMMNNHYNNSAAMKSLNTNATALPVLSLAVSEYDTLRPESRLSGQNIPISARDFPLSGRDTHDGISVKGTSSAGRGSDKRSDKRLGQYRSMNDMPASHSSASTSSSSFSSAVSPSARDTGLLHGFTNNDASVGANSSGNGNVSVALSMGLHMPNTASMSTVVDGADVSKDSNGLLHSDIETDNASLGNSPREFSLDMEIPKMGKSKVPVLLHIPTSGMNVPTIARSLSQNSDSSRDSEASLPTAAPFPPLGSSPSTYGVSVSTLSGPTNGGMGDDMGSVEFDETHDTLTALPHLPNNATNSSVHTLTHSNSNTANTVSSEIGLHDPEFAHSAGSSFHNGDPANVSSVVMSLATQSSFSPSVSNHTSINIPLHPSHLSASTSLPSNALQSSLSTPVSSARSLVQVQEEALAAMSESARARAQNTAADAGGYLSARGSARGSARRHLRTHSSLPVLANNASNTTPHSSSLAIPTTPAEDAETDPTAAPMQEYDNAMETASGTNMLRVPSARKQNHKRLLKAIDNDNVRTVKKLKLLTVVSIVMVLVLLGLAIAMFIMCKEYMERSVLLIGNVYRSSLREAYMADGASSFRIYQFFVRNPKMPMLNEIFCKPTLHGSCDFAVVQEAYHDRAVMYLDKFATLSQIIDNTPTTNSKLLQLRNEDVLSMEFMDYNAKGVHTEYLPLRVAATYFSAFIRHSIYARYKFDHADPFFFFAMANSIIYLPDAMALNTLYIEQELEQTHQQMLLAYGCIFGASILLVLFVSLIFVRPIVLQVEQSKTQVLYILQSIPFNTRKTLRRKAYIVYSQVRSDTTEDRLSNDIKEEDDTRSHFSAATSVLGSDYTSFNSPTLPTYPTHTYGSAYGASGTTTGVSREYAMMSGSGAGGSTSVRELHTSSSYNTHSAHSLRSHRSSGKSHAGDTSLNGKSDYPVGKSPAAFSLPSEPLSLAHSIAALPNSDSMSLSTHTLPSYRSTTGKLLPGESALSYRSSQVTAAIDNSRVPSPRPIAQAPFSPSAAGSPRLGTGLSGTGPDTTEEDATLHTAGQLTHRSAGSSARGGQREEEASNVSSSARAQRCNGNGSARATHGRSNTTPEKQHSGRRNANPDNFALTKSSGDVLSQSKVRTSPTDVDSDPDGNDAQSLSFDGEDNEARPSVKANLMARRGMWMVIFKFVLFVCFLSAYYGVLMWHGVHSTDETQTATRTMVVGASRNPHFMRSYFNVAQFLFFDHDVLVVYDPLNPTIRSGPYLDVGVRELAAMREAHHAVVYGNTLNVKRRSLSDEQYDLLFSSLCDLDPERATELYPDFANLPHLVNTCDTLENGIMKKGLNAFMTLVSDNLHYLLTPRHEQILYHMVDPSATIAGKKEFGNTLEYAETVRAELGKVNKLINDYIIHYIFISGAMYKAQAESWMSGHEEMSLILLLVFCFFLILSYISLFHPLASSLFKANAEAKAMMLLAPAHVLRHVKAAQAYIQEHIVGE